MDISRWLSHQWDRSCAVVLVAVGLLTLFLGWLGISDATLATQQIPYLASGGFVGLFILGVAATLWLSADMRDEWRKLDDLHQAVERAIDTSALPMSLSKAAPVLGSSRLAQDPSADAPVMATPSASCGNGTAGRSPGGRLQAKRGTEA